MQLVSTKHDQLQRVFLTLLTSKRILAGANDEDLVLICNILAIISLLKESGVTSNKQQNLSGSVKVTPP